jgi:membrane protease YdiL (CAAX protease family)
VESYPPVTPPVHVPGGPSEPPTFPPGPPGPPPPPAPPAPETPLSALDWSAGRVWLLIAFAGVLNVGQALVLKGLNVKALPGEWPHAITSAVVLAYYAVILAPILIGARRQGIRFRDAVGLRPVPAGAMVGFAIVASLAARFFSGIWVAIMTALRVQLPGTNMDLTRIFGTTPFGLVLTVVVAVIIGPFAEEVLFRGVTYGRLRETNGEVIAVLASSVAFALLHVNVYFFVPFAFIGFLFTMIVRSTKSVWTSFTAHALFNFISVLALFALKARGG